MKPEHEAWNQLRDHAALQISPGFADRVLSAARAKASPLFVAHFIMCATTATLCLVAVMLYHAGVSGDDDASTLASWNEITAQANDLDQGI